MTTTTLTSQLQARFLDEMRAIEDYVDLLQSRAQLFGQNLANVLTVLEEFGITAERPKVTLSPTSYTPEELQIIYEHVQSVRPSLEERFKEAEADLISIEEPIRLRATDARSAEGELILYVIELLNDDPHQPIEAIKEDLREHIHQEANSGDEENKAFYYSSDEEELLEFAVRSAIYVQASKRARELFSVLEAADEIELNLRIIRKEATVNIYRQGFILLMTIFDATVFELMKVALRRNFFELIGVIAKQDRLSFDRFANHTSFESLQDEIIEEKLKTKYLKDILHIINSRGITLTAETYKFGHLIELVLRRNIHIHNRGFVDERYIERNDKGESTFNVDGLAIGDFADIDQAYWGKAKRICETCIASICKWVDTLPE